MNHEVFKEELALIKDPELKAKVISILSDTPERHEHEPSSSTGKYHPPFANGEGGLVRHTKEVVRLAVIMHRALLPGTVSLDDMVAAGILHDMQKYPNPYSSYTAVNHANLMADICLAAGMPEVSAMIASHMGQWGKPVPYGEAEWVFHLADYLASRKELYAEAPK